MKTNAVLMSVDSNCGRDTCNAWDTRDRPMPAGRDTAEPFSVPQTLLRRMNPGSGSSACVFLRRGRTATCTSIGPRPTAGALASGSGGGAGAVRGGDAAGGGPDGVRRGAGHAAGRHGPAARPRAQGAAPEGVHPPPRRRAVVVGASLPGRVFQQPCQASWRLRSVCKHEASCIERSRSIRQPNSKALSTLKEWLLFP